MTTRHATYPGAYKRNPLAMCVAALLGLTAPAVFAASVFVTNCSNTGTGSLRSAIAAANSGDTVDMSSLTSSSPSCAQSTITLTTGNIVIPQNDLTIVGPGTTQLAVSGNSEYRVFKHAGSGTLRLQNMELRNGYLQKTKDTALGGCIYSSGNVSLFRVAVDDCKAYSSNSFALGGGMYVKGNASLKYSTVSNNQVINGAYEYSSAGGGIYSKGELTMRYSTISGNAKISRSTLARGIGGGAVAEGNVYILNSTIAHNSSDVDDGGLDVEKIPVNGKLTVVIVNSTISENSSASSVGGAYIGADAVSIYNSTIAFNTAATTATFLGGTYSPGIHINAPSIHLQSSLMANNTYGKAGTHDDLSVSAGSVLGSNNLVLASSARLPADTIVGKCPILGNLRFNGGPTETISLQSGSIGIDQGNNLFEHNDIIGTNEDQRGQVLDPSPYPFPRVSGSAPDIGAYEVQQSEIIFTANLEGCN